MWAHLQEPGVGSARQLVPQYPLALLEGARPADALVARFAKREAPGRVPVVAEATCQGALTDVALVLILRLQWDGVAFERVPICTEPIVANTGDDCRWVWVWVLKGRGLWMLGSLATVNLGK